MFYISPPRMSVSLFTTPFLADAGLTLTHKKMESTAIADT